MPLDNTGLHLRAKAHTSLHRLVLSLNTLLALETIGGDLFVITLESSQVFASLRELTLLHTLTNIPVDKGTLGVHEVELVRQSGPGLGDGGRVGQHAHGSVDLGQIAVGHDLRGLVADTNLETSRAPVNELDGALGLEVGNGDVGVLGDDVAAVQQTGGHVLAIARVALDHLVVGLEACVGDLHDRVGLVGGLGGRDDGGIGDEREMDTGVRDQVGLELVQIDVEGAVEAERGSDGRDDCLMLVAGQNECCTRRTLRDETVQVLVVGKLDAQVPLADVVDGLVVNHEAAVGVLQGGVRGQNGVVRLDDRGGDLRRRVHTELQLALLAVIDRQTLHQEGTETGSSSTTEGVENEETLQSGAVVGHTADLVQDLVNELLSDSVVATSIVVRSVLLASNHVLRVEQGAVGAGADLIDDVGLEIGVDGTGNVLAVACSAVRNVHLVRGCSSPVSEKKVLKPWSSSAALRSSVR